MGSSVSEPTGNIDDLDLLRNASSDQQGAFNEILLKHRERLKRMVAVRMNPKLQGRLDASDVIQETFIEATRTLTAYMNKPTLPVFLWLRQLTGQKLIQAHRRHLSAQRRDASLEESIYGGAPAANSESLSCHLMDSLTSPSAVAEKNESKAALMQALESMDELDREILTLRHFEQLNSREVSEVLGMSYDAVRKRYIRALEKLHHLLT